MMILRCMACILQMIGYELLVALVMQTKLQLWWHNELWLHCTNLGGGSSRFNIRISSCTGLDCEVKRGCGNISKHVTSPSIVLISA